MQRSKGADGDWLCFVKEVRWFVIFATPPELFGWSQRVAVLTTVTAFTWHLRNLLDISLVDHDL